jgi:hypothetical protein
MQRDLSSRSNSSFFPIRVPIIFNRDCGNGNSLAFLFIAEAISLISSGVETSSPSLTKKVSPFAFGCKQQVMIALTRFPM